eukprot:1120191-Pleurochrysis_carterae.AAC.1
MIGKAYFMYEAVNVNAIRHNIVNLFVQRNCEDNINRCEVANVQSTRNESVGWSCERTVRGAWTNLLLSVLIRAVGTGADISARSTDS